MQLHPGLFGEWWSGEWYLTSSVALPARSASERARNRSEYFAEEVNPWLDAILLNPYVRFDVWGRGVMAAYPPFKRQGVGSTPSGPTGNRPVAQRLEPAPYKRQTRVRFPPGQVKEIRTSKSEKNADFQIRFGYRILNFEFVWDLEFRIWDFTAAPVM